MQQKHETCPKTIKQWWHETPILPSEVSKLMIPRTLSSAHTKNKNIRERWRYTEIWDDLPYFSICYRLFAHFHCAMTAPVWPCRDKKIPLPNVEEELMMEAWCLLKNEEEGGLLPLPTFPLVLRAALHCLPACKSHKCPILINSFLTCHSASHRILSAPTQKNLRSSESRNAFCGFSYSLKLKETIQTSQT